MLKISNRPFFYYDFRRMNLELEKEYGKQVWTAHLQQTEDATNFTQRKNQELQNEIEQVNKKRRFSQMNEYDNFYRLHTKVHGLYSKNIDLEKECMKMEKEIAEYTDELQ